jgi:hypothetical protein
MLIPIKARKKNDNMRIRKRRKDFTLRGVFTFKKKFSTPY